MKGKGTLKVAGGKLVKVEAEFEEGALTKIKIMGDFFLYPEEGLPQLERALLGKKAEKGALENALRELLEKEKMQLLGLGPGDLADAVLMAAQSAG